jgi:hypothetical protein
VIWEPFVMALVLGLLVSAGLYFAYLWPSVEPLDEDEEEQQVEAKPAEAKAAAPAVVEKPEVLAGPPKEPEPAEPTKTVPNDGKPTEGA